MLISIPEKGKKFIFLSNTKAASTSIESLLESHSHINIVRPPALKHMPYTMMLKRFDFLFSINNYKIEKFYKFAVFRDPVDWIISWFNYRSRDAIAKTKHMFNSNYLGDTSFEEFVDSLPQEKFLRAQKYKFINAQGKNAMDFLIEYDNLEKGLKYVVNKLELDLEVKLPHQNKSRNVRIKRQDLSKNIVKKIQNHFADDYEFMEEFRQKQSQLV